jgi:hypothetical protein
MRAALTNNRRQGGLLLGCAAGALALVAAATALGQTASSNPAAGSVARPAPSQGGELDMDVNPAAPLGPSPAAQATLPDNTREIGPSGVADPASSQAALPGTQPDNDHSSAADAAQPAAPEPVSLDHPTVVDTATFQAGDTVVALFGIEGVKGEVAEGLQGFLTSHGNRITCQAESDVDFVCLQPDGTDVAEVALVNGAARAKSDAPESYRNQELAAQSARRELAATAGRHQTSGGP